MNSRQAISHSGLLLLLTVACVGQAVAGPPAQAQVRPDPPGTYSLSTTGDDPGAQVKERHVVGDHGAIMRVRDDQPSDPRRQPDDPRVNTVWGSGGQGVRVVPGVQPDRIALPEAAKVPAGAIVVQSSGKLMMRMPNVEDRLSPPQASADQANNMPPGVKVVDLPAGAVAPDGMPEPMTLYRVTAPAPQSAR